MTIQPNNILSSGVSIVTNIKPNCLPTKKINREIDDCRVEQRNVEFYLTQESCRWVSHNSRNTGQLDGAHIK